MTKGKLVKFCNSSTQFLEDEKLITIKKLKLPLFYLYLSFWFPFLYFYLRNKQLSFFYRWNKKWSNYILFILVEFLFILLLLLLLLLLVVVFFLLLSLFFLNLIFIVNYHNFIKSLLIFPLFLDKNWETSMSTMYESSMN